MRWALNDEFWMGNIFGMPKFRKQYDQLRVKSRMGLVSAAGPRHQDSRMSLDEIEAEIARTSA